MSNLADKTAEEVLAKLKLPDPVAFKLPEPGLLIKLVYPDIKLHPWQLKVSESFIENEYTQFDPYKLALVTCNGSGKDAFVIAPFVIWFILTRIKARVIITSSSGTQLTSQTETYVANLAKAWNRFIGSESIIVYRRYLICSNTGSEIRMFATDQAEKAEGYHPLEPGREMAIIINEAKSVTDEIFTALHRCTGYNFWLEVSSPGGDSGHFFNSVSLYKNVINVTSYDCPHKSLFEIEEDKLRFGENSELFRSKHLALFTSSRGSHVFQRSWLDANPTKRIFDTIRVGIDVALSTGGDETTLIAYDGNHCLLSRQYKSDNILALAEEIDKDLKLLGEDIEIKLDDSGVGRGLWPILQERGWDKVIRVISGARSSSPAEFDNLITELWFNIARLLEEGCLKLPDDAVLRKQLLDRTYIRAGNGKIRLRSKSEMRSEGKESPDRADALALCFYGTDVRRFGVEQKQIKNSNRLLLPHETLKYGSFIDIETDWPKQETSYDRAKRKLHDFIFSA